MTDIVSLLTFPPAEAARLTGVSVALQAEWRRRGFLPSKAGRHARFDAIGLAELLVMGRLSSRGIGPAVSRHHAPAVALRIVKNALRWRDAWHGDAHNAPGETWREKAAWLAAEVLGTAFDARFFVATDQGRGFVADLAPVFDARPAPGVAVVLDLEALGAVLCAGGPLATATILP